MSKVILVTNSDDWEGVYVDSLLVAEGHKIDREAFINILKQANTFDYTTEEAGEWLYDWGNLPETYEKFLELNEGVFE